MSSPRFAPWLMPETTRSALEALDQAEVREPHAVDRRAVGGVADGAVVERHLGHPQRAARGDRAGHRRAVAVGRDHREAHPVELRPARGAAPAGPRPRSRRRWSAGRRHRASMLWRAEAGPPRAGGSGRAQPRPVVVGDARRGTGRARERSARPASAGGRCSSSANCSSVRRPAATSSIVPTSTRFMWRMNAVGLDPELEQVAALRAQRAATTSRLKRTCSVSVGVKAVKSWVPPSRRGARAQRLQVQWTGPVQHAGRARKAARAGRLSTR